MDAAPIHVHMIGGEIDPGQWEMTSSVAQGDVASASPATTVDFERSKELALTFPPRVITTIELTLKQKGIPYWQRPDLGISSDDVSVEGHTMKVTVHSLGAIDSPAAKLTLRDANGKTLATGNIPSLKAPTDLVPKTAVITLNLAAKSDIATDTLTIDAPGPTPEITLVNNHITIGSLDRTQNSAERELHPRR
jgi:hypothetical protein